MVKKIIDKGSSKRKIDGKAIAEILGADISISDNFSEKDRCLEIVFQKTGRKRKAYKLSKKDLAKHRLLGTAQGINIFNCLFVASRHVDDFFKRVSGFYIQKSPHRWLTISFYEK